MARRRSWLWILFGFLFVVVLFSSAIWLLNRIFLGASPKLDANNVLVVQLAGRVVERPSVFLGGQALGPLSVREIDRTLRRAAGDPRISGVVLRVGPLLTGFAKAQEIRDAIHAFRQSDKPVVAILEIGTVLDVYVASAADTVVQVPTGMLLLGLVSRSQYYRELLDKLGVEFEVFHTGPYKTAMNPFTETGMNPREREAIESLLDSIYEQLLTAISTDRKLTVAQVAAAIDRGVLSASAAQQMGIVDELGFDDQLDSYLASPGAKRVSVRDYWKASGASGLSWGRPVIAIVHVSGMIVPGEAGGDLFGGNLAGGDTVARHLRQARKDSSVKAIVLRIDSPGGAVTGSDVIWREAVLAAEGKPLIISMSDVAASGGYWIATAGTRVLADGATYTGSIGVVSSRINLQRTYDKIGITNVTIQRGRNADIFGDTKPLTEEQRAILTASIEESYRAFIAKVASARGMDEEEVERLAAGRVWTGAQALEIGLVDEIGGLHAALRAARAEAGLRPDTNVTVRVYPRARGIFQQLISLLSVASARGAVPLGVSSAPSPEPGIIDLVLDPTARNQRIELLLRLAAAGHAWAIVRQPVPVPAGRLPWP